MSLLIDIVQQRDWSRELLEKSHVLQRVIDQHLTYYIEEQSFLRRVCVCGTKINSDSEFETYLINLEDTN